MSRWLRALTILLVVLVWAQGTSAQPAGTRAREYFDQAAQAYREGRYAVAVDLFLKAYEADPHPELIYNVGRGYEKLGESRKALRYFREYVRLAPETPDKNAVAERIKALERELAEQGVQQVTLYSNPSGASAVIDGKPVGKTPWTGELEPGRHVAVLELAGYADVTREFLLTSTRAIDVDIAFSAPAPAPVVPAAPDAESAEQPDTPLASTPAAPTEPSGLSRVSPWTWAAFGIGSAALGGALVMELSRASAENDARDARTQIEHQEHYATMEDRQSSARILAGVGAAGVLAGGVLLFFDLKSTERPAHALRVGLGCSALRCGASATATF